MSDTGNLAAQPNSVLDDPNAQAVARVYAEAFLGAANDDEQVDIGGAVEELESFVNDVLQQQAEFRGVLFSGIVSKEDKQKLVTNVVSKTGSQFLTSFLGVVAGHDRLEILPAIAIQARKQYERQQGLQTVLVRSALPLTDEQQRTVSERLRSELSVEPVIQSEVDPSLLGGLVIQIGDTVYDSSLRGRMKQLRQRLRARSHHEVQRARDRFSH